MFWRRMWTNRLPSSFAQSYPHATYHAVPQLLALRQSAPTEREGHIAVLCAGTSDLPVAEEAAITAETFGARVSRLYDVGVAGLHRLLAVNDNFEAHAVIVCAGMEGALPSVVGGLVLCPSSQFPHPLAMAQASGAARLCWAC